MSHLPQQPSNQQKPVTTGRFLSGSGELTLVLSLVPGLPSVGPTCTRWLKLVGGEMSLERTKGSFSISLQAEGGVRSRAANLAPPREKKALHSHTTHAHLRCCCRSSSDTRKKKRRLLLVRNSWRRLLSVRSGISNSSFSVENQGAREVLT